MVDGDELLGDLGILHHLADLGPDELRRGVVGAAVGGDVEERAEDELEAALSSRLVDRVARLVGHATGPTARSGCTA